MNARTNAHTQVKERKAVVNFLKNVGFDRWEAMANELDGKRTRDELKKFAKDYVTLCYTTAKIKPDTMRLAAAAEATIVTDATVRAQPPDRALAKDKKFAFFVSIFYVFFFWLVAL